MPKHPKKSKAGALSVACASAADGQSTVFAVYPSQAAYGLQVQAAVNSAAAARHGDRSSAPLPSCDHCKLHEATGSEAEARALIAQVSQAAANSTAAAHCHKSEGLLTDAVGKVAREATVMARGAVAAAADEASALIDKVENYAPQPSSTSEMKFGRTKNKKDKDGKVTKAAHNTFEMMDPCLMSKLEGASMVAELLLKSHNISSTDVTMANHHINIVESASEEEEPDLAAKMTDAMLLDTMIAVAKAYDSLKHADENYSTQGREEHKHPGWRKTFVEEIEKSLYPANDIVRNTHAKAEQLAKTDGSDGSYTLLSAILNFVVTCMDDALSVTRTGSARLRTSKTTKKAREVTA